MSGKGESGLVQGVNSRSTAAFLNFLLNGFSNNSLCIKIKKDIELNCNHVPVFHKLIKHISNTVFVYCIRRYYYYCCCYYD